MPVIVRDQKAVVAVTYDPEATPLLNLCDVVLDSTNFPWKVLRQFEIGCEDDQNFHREITCILEPYRPLNDHHEVRSLQSLESALIDAYRDRIYNYQILIESMDLAVSEVTIWEEDYDALKTGATFFPTYYRKDSNLPKGSIFIKDKEGITWGPLPCSPLDEPLSWPLPGRIGKATILPESGRLFVSYFEGVIRISMDSLGQAIRFATSLDNKGWHQALGEHFPGKVFTLRNKDCLVSRD